MQFPRGGIVLGLAYLLGFGMLGPHLPLTLLLRPPGVHPSPPPTVETATPRVSVEPSRTPEASATPGASTYSGTTSHPLQDSEEDLGRCHDQLQALGTELAARLDKAQGVRVDQLGLAYTCPTSNLSYRWLVQPGRSLLYCSGGSHPGHALHWDSTTRVTATDWPELPEGAGRAEALMLRYEASVFDEDTARTGELLEALQSTDTDREFLCVKRAALGLDLGDPACALETLKELKNGENNPEAQAIMIQAQLQQSSFAEAESAASEILLEDASNQDLRMLQLIAMVYGQRWDEASTSLEKLTISYYLTFAHMALGNSTQARLAALQTLQSEGWWSDKSALAAMLAVLNGWKAEDGESLLRSELAEALQKAPKLWPYPMLRYLNGELSDDELLQLADTPPRRREALLTMSLKALWKDGKDLDSQRERLEEVAAHPRYFEGMVAFALLHPR